MKRLLLVVLTILPLFFASCQCSDKPEIGPIEDEASLMHKATVDLA